MIRCKLLKKGIPQWKNSERDINIFIKWHIFHILKIFLTVTCRFIIILSVFIDDNNTNYFFQLSNGDMISRASRDKWSSTVATLDNAEGFQY